MYCKWYFFSDDDEICFVLQICYSRSTWDNECHTYIIQEVHGIMNAIHTVCIHLIAACCSVHTVCFGIMSLSVFTATLMYTPIQCIFKTSNRKYMRLHTSALMYLSIQDNQPYLCRYCHLILLLSHITLCLLITQF